MRALVPLLLLSACATAIPSERVNGCWASQDEAAPVTLRFTPDRNRPGILHGALIRTGVRENYDLRQYVAGWSFCRMTPGEDHCWQVAEAESGSLEGGRAFIDSEADHLRISIIGQDGEQEIFEGVRTSCR
jgi:hypothetical protein